LAGGRWQAGVQQACVQQAVGQAGWELVASAVPIVICLKQNCHEPDIVRSVMDRSIMGASCFVSLV
jgi:hypothetical protein